MKKIANILYIWLIQVHLALSECYDTTYTRCDEFNQFDGYIMSYDTGKLPIWYDNQIDKINLLWKYTNRKISTVDGQSCQTTICQSNDDCKAFIYDSTVSELGCHIFNKNLDWENCEKVGAYINDDIDTCQNGQGCDVNSSDNFNVYLDATN